MAVLAFLFFMIAIIVGFIIKAVEIAAETGSTAVRKTSELGKYVKDSWKEANEELREADRQQRNL
jgi:hypothetical protein